MSDGDDDEEDFAQSFRRLVRATEKQIKFAEEERHKVHGLEIEVTNSEMRTMLGEHARMLREKVEEYRKRPEPPSYEDMAAEHVLASDFAGGISGGITSLPKRSTVKGPFRPPSSIMNQMDLQATYCIQWASRLTNEKKVFKLSLHDWGMIFGRPDLVAGIT